MSDVIWRRGWDAQVGEKKSICTPRTPKTNSKSSKNRHKHTKKKGWFPKHQFSRVLLVSGRVSAIYIYITLSMLLKKNKMLIPIIMQQLPRTIRNRQPYENPHRKLKSIPEKHPNFPGIPQVFFFLENSTSLEFWESQPTWCHRSNTRSMTRLGQFGLWGFLALWAQCLS